MQPMSSRPKSSKWIFIVLGIVVLGVIVFLVMRFLPMGFGNQTYSNSQGQVTTGPGAGMPSDWPSDAPANYSGAKILYSGSANPQAGRNGVAVSYTLQGVSVQNVADYYQNSLTAQGWKVVGNVNLGGQIIIGAKKDARTFGVSILDNGNGITTVTAGLEL